ncbi:MAG: helix-turn-helix domain-containing protein [Bacteroidota bacterium]
MEIAVTITLSQPPTERDLAEVVAAIGALALPNQRISLETLPPKEKIRAIFSIKGTPDAATMNQVARAFRNTMGHHSDRNVTSGKTSDYSCAPSPLPLKPASGVPGFYFRLHQVAWPPHAQADIEQHFRIPPPSVHQMVLTLHKKGFLRRVAGQARSLEVLVDRPSLPYR